MINKARVASMTKLAIYKKGNTGKDIEISRHYKFDYISLNMLNCMFWILLIYAGVIACGAVLMFEEVLSLIIANELLAFMIQLAYGLIGLWVITSVLSFFVYRRRYIESHKAGKKHYIELVKLNKLYTKEY